jgi:hypothetical protein
MDLRLLLAANLNYVVDCTRWNMVTSLESLGWRSEVDEVEAFKLDVMDSYTDNDVKDAIFRTKEKRRDAWKRAGISHISSSHLGTASSSLAKWFMSYIKNVKTESNPSMTRGKVVEHAIFLKVMGIEESIDECVIIAKRRFQRELLLNGHAMKLMLKEFENLEPMIRNGIDFFEKMGKPDLVFDKSKDEFIQPEIQLKLDKVECDCLGYMDAVYREKKLIIDLKTSVRSANSLTRDWRRQGALYAAGNPNYSMSFLVVTTKDVHLIEQTKEEIADGLNEATLIAQTIQRFLMLREDPEKLAELIVPDFTSFKMQEPVYQKLGREIWGF